MGKTLDNRFRFVYNIIKRFACDKTAFASKVMLFASLGKQFFVVAIVNEKFNIKNTVCLSFFSQTSGFVGVLTPFEAF